MATIIETPIVIQGEALTIVPGGGDPSLARTQTSNQEKDGANGTPNDLVADPIDDNPGLPQYDDYGLRPDYTGDGYLDINGNAGAKLQFQFDAEPGTYEVTLRVANGSASRPIKLETDAGQTASQATRTPDWFLWELRTFEITVGDPAQTGDVQTHDVTIVTEVSNGPNIDAIAIANVGTPISFVAPAISAAAMDILENTLVVGQVAGSDKDGQTLTYSLTGGADADLFEITSGGELSFKAAPDFEAPRSNTYEVEVSATDGVDTASQTISVVVADDPELVQPVIDQELVQAEAGDIEAASGAAETLHRVNTDISTAETGTPGQGGDKPLDEFGLRPGYTGTGYTDFNGSAESVSWTVTAPAAGAYDLHIRFASVTASSTMRPLDIAIGDGPAETLSFVGNGFENWIVREAVQVVLAEGENVVTLSIPDGFSNGPNIDALVLTTVGEAPDFTPPEFDAPVAAVDYAENGTEAVANMGATDPDAGDVVTYALEGDDAAAFDVSAEGIVSFAASPDHEAPADADADNVYDVTVAATSGGTTVRKDLAVTVTDVAEGPSAVTLAAVAFDENAPGAIVADIAIDGGTPSLADFTVSNEATYRVVEVEGAFKLALLEAVSLDAEAASQPAVTVSLGDLTSASFVPAPNDVDEAPALTITSVSAPENAEGAVVAEITVDDPEGDVFAAAEFTVSDARFEVVDQDGFKLKLVQGASLDFEGDIPSVEVSVGGTSATVVPQVTDLAEALSVMFDPAGITPYGGSQDQPDRGGAGVSVSEDGNAITLDGNLWKRAEVPAFTVAEGTVLSVTVKVTGSTESVAIGFDVDNDPFDLDGTVYQIAGPLAIQRFVDLRGTGTDLGDGRMSFRIDLSEHAGMTVDSLVLVADDDNLRDGLGSVTFSDIEIDVATSTGNADPRVVGGGVADFVIDEGSMVEIDLPFVDDDGDALTYEYAVTLDGAPVTAFPLAIEGGVLTGDLGDTAPGVYEITVTASDSIGQPATDVFTITVENVNERPVADQNPSFEPYFGAVGEEMTSISLADFAGAFSDPDGDALTLSATNLPDGLIFDAGEGVIYGTPTNPGDGTFTVVATDPEGLTASIEIDLLIDAPEAGDVITIEAEDFTGLGDGSTGFFATGQAGASGDRLIRTNPNTEGSVETVLAQNGVVEGWYTFSITVYDETDGEADFALTVGGVQLSADGATYSDAGTFTNPSAGRGTAGQLGNRKILTFEQAVYVDESTVLSLTGSADGELLRTDSVTLTRVVTPNVAPDAPVLTGGAVSENVDGATVGTLSAVDPDGDDAAITFSVDAGSPFEVVGDELRLKAGQSLDFEAGSTVSVEVTATDATGASTTATLSVAVADVDEAPQDLILVGGTVAENAEGAVIGTLGAFDPEDGSLTFSVSDPRFVVEDATLRLADGLALDFEAGTPVSVDVTASDGVNDTVATFDVAVSDANDAPVIGAPAALIDIETAFAAESRTDLTVLAATDQDAGDTVSYGVRSGTAAALPAGITVDGTELVVAGDVPAGTYGVEIFATDGTLESDSVSLNVTVGDAAPFDSLVLQGEVAQITLSTAPDGDDTITIHRDQDDDSEDETPGTDKILENGLRAGFSGNGYIDFGDDAGDTATFTFTVPAAGEYDLSIRYSSQDADGNPRVLDLGVNGTAATTTFPSTDTDAPGAAGNGFNNWAFLTQTVTLAAGENTVTLALASGTTAGPNVDRIEITPAGTGPVASDTSADVDGDLLLDGPADPLNETQAASINFRVGGLDEDIVKIEISFDGGATRIDVTDKADADGDFVVIGADLAAGPQTARIIVTDAAGNEAFDEFDFVVGETGGPVDFGPVTIQAEDESQVTVLDTGTGNDDTTFTRVVNADSPDAFGNFRPGAVGGEYVDFGTDAGDAISVSLTVPADGTYTATIRYANGGADTRPLAISVNGGAAENLAFAPTGTGDVGWETWTDITIDLDLARGENTIEIAIPTAANGGVSNGPNIDQITFTATGIEEPTDAQRFEDVVRINFEAPTFGNGSFNAPAGYQTPEGFESDTGAAFGDRGNGFTYGWVDVDDATGEVTGNPLAQPTGSARYKDVATEASDLQKTYLHFDYPGAPDGDRERAWEIELENGTYELSVAIGDTAGQYDSNYVLNVEGQQFGNDWEPVNNDGQKLVGGAYNSSFDGEGFRSTVHTGIVQVTDGRLTIDGTDGENVEIQWLDLQRVPDLTPDDGRTADLDYSKFVAAVAASTTEGQVSIEIGEDGSVPLDINPTSDIVVGVQLQAIDHRGPSVASVDGVRLYETLTGQEVEINVQVTGGADGLTIRPIADLKEFTSYTLDIKDVLDLGNLTDSSLPQRQFQDYTTSFVTGEAPEIEAREVAFTDTVVLDGFSDGGIAFTSIEFGPDGKIYTSSIMGEIKRWDVNADGTLDKASVEVLNLDYFQAVGRSIIGLAFDPEDPNTIWVTDNAPVPREGKADQTPEFSGQISKITLGAGGSFDGAVAETYVTGLPRSGGDHVTNSIEFRANPDAGVDGAPNFLLYFTQGSNSAAGRPDNSWGFRPERLLNAAVLEVDHTRDAPAGGFDVQTEPYDAGSNDPTYRTTASFNEDGTFAGFYDPFADDAVLKIFGEGIRNAYDLVWHSNGNLYVPTNGTARGGNTLDDPNTAIVEQLSGLDKQFDFLFQVKEGGYYGHPNSLLENYVVNGGNPSDPADSTNIYGQDVGADTPDGGAAYPVGVDPDADYDIDGTYSLGFNKSPNGATEYTNDAFGSNLKGAVLFVQFSQGDNVRVINVDPVTGRVTGDDVLRRPNGDEIDEYIDPLDIIENPITGQLYMVTLNRGTGESQIVLLNPAPGGVTADLTADEGNDLALSVLDGTDASNVIFAVTGLDADIETITVSFDSGATSETVTLDAQGRFVRDLSGATGPVTATLTVADEVPNTAGTSVTFTPGEASGSVFIDARAFTLLDLDDGSVIRKLDDATTHENATSGNDISPKDGLNDGYDGDSYLDPNGGAEAKASFVFDANGAGTYELVFRMAANSDRSVAIQTGGQSKAITVNTGEFTNWADYTIQLELVDGPNTIVIAQTGAAGPNVDSVTITPIDVAADETADENGDLAISLLDASDRTATEFAVTGLDDDIQTLSVSFDGGATTQPVTVENGTFTVNTSALSGEVTVTLVVADGALNTASAQTTASFAAVVANDGTQVIDGMEYTLYEAENASLAGPVVIDESVDDRNAAGDGFVDFDGTTDQSITWTIEVGEDGLYEAAILYALSTSKNARPMTLSVDGTVVDTLGFAPNSTTDENVWGPQPFALDLTAGVHTITVTAPGANGPNVDQLRISSVPAVAGDPDADISIRSLDPAFFEDRLHFSWLEDNQASAATPREFKENAFVEISNTGTADLEISSASISGPFELAVPGVFDGLTLAGGESITVEVLFDRSAYTPTNGGSSSGVFDGSLVLRTNDAEDRIATVDLSGFWQSRDEGGQEPNINEVWDVLGFGNSIAGLPFAGGGESAQLDFYDLFLPVDETEAMSPYFRIADGVDEARVTMIAAFNASASAGIRLHSPGDKGTGFNVTSWNGAHSQTLFPLQNGNFATATFDRGRIPDAWDGNDVFGITMAGLSTDPTLNPSGGGTVSQTELNARYPGYTVTNGTVFDPDGNEVPDGYTVRMFQAVDGDGNVIPNVYLGVMDYTGINYDYNDNMFIIEGVQAVGNGAVLSVDGLDAAAADDRLVFSAIDNPQNGQVTRDEATFEVVNDGTGTMNITSVDVDGAFTVTGIEAGDTVAAGGSVTVTVTFDGTDGVNDDAAVLFEGGVTIGTNVGSKTVALSGLAQLESERGEEPSVAQIAEAFGYGTDMAQNQLANGGTVEAVGDEVLLPYLERLDGSKPVEVIQIAAYLNQGNVARLSSHSLDSAELDELFAADDNQGQTLLPDGLVPGTGNTGSVAAATIDSDEPFGLKVTVDGRPTYASWTDPEANRIDPDFGNLVSDDAGHLIRFFQAKDAAGNVIEGTFIGIQDYPGAGNYDYNDHMFVVKNVKAHVLTAAEDANANGVNDALETDTDNDGTVDFFDADTATPTLNRGDYVVGFNVGGPAIASQTGLDGVALRGDGDPLISYAGDGATRAPGTDSASNPNGANALPGAFKTYRDGTNWSVEVGGLVDGEYVVVLHTQETYFNSAGQRVFDMAIDGTIVADNLDPFAVAGGDTNVPVEALVTVSGGSFTVTLDTIGGDGINNAPLNAITIYQSGDNPGGGLAGEDGNTAPTASGITGAPEGTEDEAYSFDVSPFFADADAGDTLTFTATGLPAGLAISAEGVISGTVTGIDADLTQSVTVTASDGEASVTSSFDLTFAAEEGTGPVDGQSPFGGTAPVIGTDEVVIAAAAYDNGGQGVAYNDDPGLAGGSNGGRTGSDVEVTSLGDVGWISTGEWLEYTVDVAVAGTYDLDLLLATNGGSGRTATVTFTAAGQSSPYASTGQVANPNTGGWTTFQERSSEVELQAGEQVVRILFEGGSQDFRSFSLTAQETVANLAPVAGEIADAAVEEGGAISLDLSNVFADPDGDDLSYSVSGLAGLSISAGGLLTGTAPQVGADTDYTVVVTASDGSLSGSASFTLTVEDLAEAAQTPFPGPNAPVIGADAVFIDAGTFDAGGQGISWNDDLGLNGFQTARADTDVELVGAEQDIGYVEAGEWVEYTVNVAEAGTYDLSVNAKTPIGGNTVTVSIEGGSPLATFALADSNGTSNSFTGTTFADTPAQQVFLAAGEQTIRVAFDGAPATNGYLLDYRGLTIDRVEDVVEDGPIGEAGSVTFAQSGPGAWTTVSFSQALDNPSVVVGPLSLNDRAPATVRVRNVTDTGFEVQIDEWDYLDGVHAAEKLQWVALEAGTHEIDGRTVVAGSGTATGNDSSLSFGPGAFDAKPIVFAQITSAQNANAATAQLNTVTATGFTLDLDRQEFDQRELNLAHGTEAIDWIAVEGGGHTGADSFSGVVTGVAAPKAVSLPISSGSRDDFVFLADMQQEAGIDTATVRLDTAIAGGWRVFIEEEASRDTELNHAPENVGYFGIENGLIFEDISIV